MLELIKDFIDLKYDAETFISLIIKNDINKFNPKKIVDLLDYCDNIDQSSIIYLLLYFIKKIKFENIEHDFVDFLESIEYEADNDFNKEIEWVLKEKNFLIFSIDNVYFLINNSNRSTKLTLPKEMQNEELFCLNCNHELLFEETLNLEPYEFYLVLKKACN